ncbi:MAG TPA: arginine--tRNA ligase [Steroidobacteraceae bacterium]|jgi:hypothetical protein|nr:arginine--tRNA ligase [Steroidobacteraceae bacterium]
MLKTRAGEAVSLDQLIDEAVHRAGTLAQGSLGLAEEQRRHVAEAVGVGAVKYADLVNDRIRIDVPAERALALALLEFPSTVRRRGRRGCGCAASPRACSREAGSCSGSKPPSTCRAAVYPQLAHAPCLNCLT